MKVYEGDLVTVIFTASEDVEFDQPIRVDILTNLHNDIWADEDEDIILTVERDWKFGDVVTEDNQPEQDFKVVDEEGIVLWDSAIHLAHGTMRLVWLDGKELQ